MEFYSQPPDVELKGGVLTFAFDASDLHLGPTRAFNFELATQRTSAPATTLDQAPDAGAKPWSFQLKTAAVRISVVGLTEAPRKPKAGHSFVVSLVVKPSAAIANLETRLDGPVCAAAIAGKPLFEHDSVMEGSAGSSRVAARCTWRIPAGAGGEAIRGSVKVSFMGKTLSRSFSATIAK